MKMAFLATLTTLFRLSSTVSTTKASTTAQGAYSYSHPKTQPRQRTTAGIHVPHPYQSQRQQFQPQQPQHPSHRRLEIYGNNVDDKTTTYSHISEQNIAEIILAEEEKLKRLNAPSTAPSEAESNAGFDNQIVSDETNIYSRLKTQLLSKYNRFSFPFDEVQYFNETDNTIRGLDLNVSMNIHKVSDVDVVSASIELMVWYGLSWFDPRLKWDPAEFDVKMLQFWVEGGSGFSEASEIWTPDMYLWNYVSPISETLNDVAVIVRPNGLCLWIRPGFVKPACRFEGLEQFPFDELSCELEFGAWTHTGAYIYPKIHPDGGVSIGGSETAGQTYAEFTLSDVSVREHVYPPYPVAPEENWPVIFYKVSFHRAWEPYTRGYLSIQIILNLVALLCFWLPPHSGERMGLGITAMLAAVASDLFVADKIPFASEATWVAKFSLFSLTFNTFVIFQSTMVVYFYHLKRASTLPWYLNDFVNYCRIYFYNLRNRFRESGMKDNSMPYKNGSEIDDDGVVPEESTADTRSAAFIEGQSADVCENEVETRSVTPESNRESPKDEGLGHDFDDYKTRRERVNNLKWQQIAENVDEVCRVAIPTLYVVILAIFLSNAR